MKKSLFICAFFISFSAVAQYEDPTIELKRGQPKQVADLIDRIVECNHWGGEEPYDAERAKEIHEAASELRCQYLESDEKRLLKRYPKSSKALDDAKQLPL